MAANCLRSWPPKMNMPNLKDGSNWTGMLIGAAVSGVAAFFLFVYEFQNNKIWDYGNAISKLEVEETNRTTETARIETEITAINNTMMTVLGSIQTLKDGSDTQTSAIHDLQTRFDHLDAALRPLRGPAGAPN